MKLNGDFKMCNHCGEVFFKEHIASNGKCKICNDSHISFFRNENNIFDD